MVYYKVRTKQLGQIMGRVIKFNIAKRTIAKLKRKRLVIEKETKKRQDRLLKTLIRKSKRTKKSGTNKPSIDNYKLDEPQDKNDG